MDQTSIKKRYNNIIIDSVNLFYKVWDSKEEKPAIVSQKTVYKESICKFIKQVEYLKATYLHSDGDIWLLFDNYFSKADLATAFTYADRKSMDAAYKATRKKENRPFYQSLNFIRYYYLIGPSTYHTARMSGLEADDLVRPLLTSGKISGTSLFVTTDLDWARYMSEDIDCIRDFAQGPVTIHDLAAELTFPVSEASIILYKAIFGDKSDNIQSILPQNEENIKLFRTAVDGVKVADAFIYKCRNHANESPIYQAVVNNEKQYSINKYLVSTIGCGKAAFIESLYDGKQETTLYKTVREAIGLETSSKKFSFGVVKRPRA